MWISTLALAGALALKSDLGGIEITLTSNSNPSKTLLKSDLGGIEMIVVGLYFFSSKLLKSDLGGIEMYKRSLTFSISHHC